MSMLDDGNPHPSAARDDRAAHAVAGVLGLVFLLVQIWTIDYGTRINNLEAVRSYRFSSSMAATKDESFEARKTAIAGDRSDDEAPDSADDQMLRFKLYSVNPDEHIAILALRRIQPERFDFDPDLYQYGGAFLYPLGLLYFGLAKLGIIDVGSLGDLLRSSDGLDRVYIAGRLFVLAVFAFSAWILFRACRLVADAWSSTWAVGIYLFAPASIMYSVLIKPHWYLLLWVCAALFFFVRGWARNRFTAADEAWLGLFIGLTVASAPLNGISAMLAGGALAAAAWQRILSPYALVRVPLIALAVAFVTSPYFFLGIGRLSTEVSYTGLGARFSMNPKLVWDYLTNPLPLGFGVALIVLLIALGLYRLVARRGPMTWWAASSLGGLVIFYAMITPGSPEPQMNFRIMPFFLAIAVLIVVCRPWPYRNAILAMVFALTVLQSLPHKLAYLDENDPERSTRLRAARWVAAELPAASTLCPSGGGVNPTFMVAVDLERFRVARDGHCDYLINVATTPAKASVGPGDKILAIFKPRLWNDRWPVVYGYINPYIAIIKPRAAQGSNLRQPSAK